jgi:hypothetical protein
LVSNLGCRGVNRRGTRDTGKRRVEPRNHIENVGKSALDETGKDPVNKNAEENFRGSSHYGTDRNIHRHSGAMRSIEPGISRFRVRAFARPGMTVH